MFLANNKSRARRVIGAVSGQSGRICAPMSANANGKLNRLPTENDNILINLIYTSDSAAELKASRAKQVTVMLELSDLKNK